MLFPETDPRPTVVLAEDDPELCSLLAFCLYQAGYNVTSCRDGLCLLERIQAGLDGEGERVALVVTDIRMPGLTGLEVLEAYQDLPEVPPMICMTAFGDRETHEQALRLRAKAVLDKPFDIDLLLETAKRLCPPVKPHLSARRLS